MDERGGVAGKSPEAGAGSPLLLALRPPGHRPSCQVSKRHEEVTVAGSVLHTWPVRPGLAALRWDPGPLPHLPSGPPRSRDQATGPEGGPLPALHAAQRCPVPPAGGPVELLRWQAAADGHMPAARLSRRAPLAAPARRQSCQPCRAQESRALAPRAQHPPKTMPLGPGPSRHPPPRSALYRQKLGSPSPCLGGIWRRLPPHRPPGSPASKPAAQG